MYTEQAFIDEVIDLHEFLQAWLKGETDNETPGLARLNKALYEHFTVVHPTGLSDDKSGVLANFGSAHGARSKDYQLRVDEIQPRLPGGGLSFVTYREAHIEAGQPARNRLATAILQMDLNSGAITWLHLHETLLPEQ